MTNSDRNCLVFKWTIEKVSYCWHQKGEILESPSFIIKVLQETEWCLFVYPKGYQESSFLLYLKRKDNGKGPKEINLDFELSILGENGSPVKTPERTRRPFYKNSSYGGNNIPSWDEILKFNRDYFLPNENLTICCKIWKIDEEFPIPLQCSARTKISSEFSFSANIPNFKNFQLKKSNGLLIGSTNAKNLNFILILTDGLYSDENMFIEVFSTDQKIRFISFQLYLVDTWDKKVECIRGNSGFYYKRNNTWIFPLEFSLRKLASNFLKLQCQCCFSNGELIEEFETANSYIVDSKCSVSANLKISENAPSSTSPASEILKSLYTEKILCDVKLRSQMETFPAHRSILSARSPVFRTMFTSDMKEKTSQFVDVPEVEPDILRFMLRYIYTESLEDLHYQSAYQLYVAADMYQIIDLRNKCSAYLRCELNRFNACDVLVLADVYQDIDLKRDVQNFIVKEGKNIFTSDEWKDLTKENVQLAADTMLFKCVRE